MGSKSHEALETLVKHAGLARDPREIRRLEQQRAKKLLGANLGVAGAQGAMAGGLHYLIRRKNVPLHPMVPFALGGISALNAIMEYAQYANKSGPYKIRRAPKKK